GTPVRGETDGSAHRSDRVGCRTYANGYRRHQGRSALGARQARLDGRAARRENRYLLRAARQKDRWRLREARRKDRRPEGHYFARAGSRRPSLRCARRQHARRDGARLRLALDRTRSPSGSRRRAITRRSARRQFHPGGVSAGMPLNIASTACTSPPYTLNASNVTSALPSPRGSEPAPKSIQSSTVPFSSSTAITRDLIPASVGSLCERMFSQLGGWKVQPGPAIFTPFSRRYASFANGTSDFSKLPTLSPPG